MGLFSGKTRTYVSSVVYNMAGDINKRPNFLRTTIAGNILQGSEEPISQSLVRSYLKGPGLRLRSFANWADNAGYSAALGLTTGSMSSSSNVNLSVLAGLLPHAPATTVEISEAEVGVADYGYWAEQWILANRPAQINADWQATFDEYTHVLTLTFPDASVVSFTATGYSANSEYLYVTYHTVSGTTEKTWTPLEMMIYQRGSGNAELDAMFVGSGAGKFFPFIPLRLNNNFISSSYYADIYERNKKAYKKLTGGKYTKLIDSIADNGNLSDIDYAFCVMGVSLNSKEQAARLYLFKFFKHLMASTPNAFIAYESWKVKLAQAIRSREAYESWQRQNYDADGWQGNNSPPPQLLPIPTLPAFNLTVASHHGWASYNMNIKWNSIREFTGNGLGRAGAKQGDVWIVTEPTEEYQRDFVSRTTSVDDDSGFTRFQAPHRIECISIYYQERPNFWRRLRIHGLQHTNLVYGGHTVQITGLEALADNDESGFIIPLHEDTFKAMGVKHGTQLSTACSYIVFNCYQVVKQKWYQTGIFQIIVIVIVVILTIVFPPAGGVAASAGVLGTNIAIGTALGFAGTAAIIVGAVANALAAMILSKIIMKASTALLGDKLGAIVGAIASFAAMQIGTAMATGQPIASVFSNLSRVDNLIRITSSVSNGISGYMQAGIQDTIAETAKVMQEYEQSATKIAEAYSSNLGSTGIQLDPYRLTESTMNFMYEAPDSFLSRTLMTGSDIAETTQKLISNFASLTLNLELQT